jgi:hypothetical protein
MRCGEKWGKNHWCPEKVSLHALEELLDILPIDSVANSSSDDSSEGEVYSLSQSAVVGVSDKKAIKITGTVKNRELLILIDSGSTCSFMSESTTTALQCVITLAQPIQITVANGEKLDCNQQVLNTWWSQGHTFTSDVRILPLPYYDMVLGMDWLEHFSPLWIH